MLILHLSAWYKQLVENNQIMGEEENEESSEEENDQDENDQEHQKPYVPWRKDLKDVSTF